MVGRTADQRVSAPVLEAAWLTLTFVHWPVPRPAGQSLRPLGVGSPREASRRTGRAARVLHELSSSPETNLSTYVRGPDGRDGIWFLSLEIGTRALAVALRGLAGAPYHYGRLRVDRDRDT